MRTEPEPGLDGEAAHLAAYLAFYRETVVEKCRSLPREELRSTRVPSGWSPLELLNHLAHMERRWLVWGFLGEQLDEPWADGEERWRVAEDRTLDDVVDLLREVGARTEEVLRETPLESTASSGGRFAGESPPELRWICFHVLQEYARHAGHLDIAVELAGGHLGQ
jgi:uncharacterized damage-inducible protein DinB